MKLRIEFFIILGIANSLLFIPALRPLGAILLTLILPGWGWARVFWPRIGPLATIALASGFSFSITMLGSLCLHYLPGPILSWYLLLLLNGMAILPFFKVDLNTIDSLFLISPSNKQWKKWLHPFGLILIIALFLRFTDLGYSEFQGDEALAMITAAEAIEGEEKSLFLRGKGPGEVLLPLALWSINGTITEGLARVPFAVAGMAVIITLYLIANSLTSTTSPTTSSIRLFALYSAGFLASSGFMVGFSRIVQYQTLVLWMSSLSLWTFWKWYQQEDRQKNKRWVFVSGVFLGVGLLAHYDAILVVPAIGWIWLVFAPFGTQWWVRLQTLLLWWGGMLASSLLFYVPYFLDPQINRTGSYLGDRIGEGLLKNNLGDFLHFNSFYSSFYYVVLGVILLFFFLAWAFQKAKWGRSWLTTLVIGIGLGIMLNPKLLDNWTAIPLGIILVGAFLSTSLTLSHQIMLIWFAIPFMGYNFGVETALTHIYTIFPGWALLVGWSASWIFTWGSKRIKTTQWNVMGVSFSLTLLIISTVYLWNGYVRHDVEFLQDYPQGNLAFYWSPYNSPPKTGFFGFVHKTGWKSVGTLMANKTLVGDYDSNEEEAVSSWYTHHALRACDPGAEFYFVASDIIDEIPLPDELLASNYTIVGKTALPNNKTLNIYQQNPTTLNLGLLNEDELAAKFDYLAIPSTFSRSKTWQVQQEVNFGGKLKLWGYDLNDNRAYADGRIILTLYWQILAPLEESYKVFVHLDSDKKFAQADSFPVCGQYPTNLWRPEQIIADHHALHLSPDTPIGSIPLVIGLYLPETGQRLDVLDVAGNAAGVSLTLTEMQIRNK